LTAAEWHDIPGCAGFQASPDGQIFDVRRGRLKKQRPAGNGAMQVDIGNSVRMVHDLVARAFYGCPGSGYRVKHINGDLSDNRVENLVWTGRPKNRQEPTMSLESEYEFHVNQHDIHEIMALMMPGDYTGREHRGRRGRGKVYYY